MMRKLVMSGVFFFCLVVLPSTGYSFWWEPGVDSTKVNKIHCAFESSALNEWINISWNSGANNIWIQIDPGLPSGLINQIVAIALTAKSNDSNVIVAKEGNYLVGLQIK